MRNSISFFILAAVLGSQAVLTHGAIRENDAVIHGFHQSPDCCFSYASFIPCSRFIYYFPTSGGCIMPGIIFITKKGKRVCANPSDLRVQECISTLKQVPRPGNKLIA